MINITDVRINLLSNGGKTKAFAGLVIDNELFINDFKVMDGSSGLFVAYPSKKVGEEWKNTIYTTKDSATKEYISERVLQAYKAKLDSSVESNAVFSDDLPY